MKKLLQKFTAQSTAQSKISANLPVQPLTEQESSQLSDGANWSTRQAFWGS